MLLVSLALQVFLMLLASLLFLLMLVALQLVFLLLLAFLHLQMSCAFAGISTLDGIFAVVAGVSFVACKLLFVGVLSVAGVPFVSVESMLLLTCL
jgi:hypothetical protein